MSERRLRVLHMATLVTPDGAYGGPVRVAVNQVKALRERGHDVVLAAGAAGFDTLPTTWDGAPTALFPARRAVPGQGFAGTCSPAMLAWIRRTAPRFDVAHVHLARDLVTMPAALAWMRTGKPFVTQTHGMVMPSDHRFAAPVDALATRRVLRRASRAFYLTDHERAGLFEVSRASARLGHLVNGVPIPTDPGPPANPPEVLFLARLHRRKRPADFVRAAAALAPEFPDVRFTLVGPDEGEGARVKELIGGLSVGAHGAVSWEGSIPPEDVAQRISRSTVYVLPSRDEPFPMSVLEAMAGSRPVLVTDGNGLAPEVAAARAGMVIRSQDDLVTELRRLLRDPDLCRQMGSHGRKLVKERFSMAAVAADLEAEYAAAIRP